MAMAGAAAANFQARIAGACKIIDAQEFAVMSNRTVPARGRNWGIVHWRTAETIALLYPDTYKITQRGRRIRNVKLHPPTEEER